MNVLRSFMLIGSLGKVWSTTRFSRNVFSTISIVAYFKLLDDYENNITGNIVVVPGEPIEVGPNKPPTPIKRVESLSNKRRAKLKQTMRNINRAIYEY